MIWLTGALLYLAAVPFGLAVWNLILLKAPSPAPGADSKISVLIPARNEAANISRALSAVQANGHGNFEVIVLDDNSDDDTAALVATAAAHDGRITLYQAPPLPQGWSGKMRACDLLAQHATGDLLLFVDCDVTLQPHCLQALDAFMAARPRVFYASGIPRQDTRTLAEAVVVPLIHFMMLAYLPIFAMRRSLSPALAAGCGQLAIMRRDAYAAIGGHATIPRTMHDGLKLPRRFRVMGYRTDLFDATGLATCRMYHGARQVWHGFGKNATEGLASPRALPIWTMVLAGGQVVPFVLLPFIASGCIFGASAWCIAAAAAASMATRMMIGARTQSSLAGNLLHPIGVAIMLAIQWSALYNAIRKRPSEWRGRNYQVDAIP